MKAQILDTIYTQKATLSSIFGAKTTNNCPYISEPQISDLPNLFIPVYLEYITLFLVIGFLCFAISSNRIGFDRIMSSAFSFDKLTRRVEMLDRSLDNAAKKSLVLILFVIISFTIKDKVFWGLYNSEPQQIISALHSIGAAFAFVVILPLITLIIDRYNKHRYFYKRLYVLERVQLAGYALILIPLNILMFTASPFYDILLVLSLILLLVYVFHNIIVVIRYFLREKLSFYQLFLYLCTLKAAFVFILIFYIRAALDI